MLLCRPKDISRTESISESRRKRGTAAESKGEVETAATTSLAHRWLARTPVLEAKQTTRTSKRTRSRQPPQEYKLKKKLPNCETTLPQALPLLPLLHPVPQICGNTISSPSFSTPRKLTLTPLRSSPPSPTSIQQRHQIRHPRSHTDRKSVV